MAISKTISVQDSTLQRMRLRNKLPSKLLSKEHKTCLEHMKIKQLSAKEKNLLFKLDNKRGKHINTLIFRMDHFKAKRAHVTGED